MAKLLLIADATVRSGASVNDLVGVFDDSHIFSTAELATFRVVSVAVYTKDQIEAALLAVLKSKLILAGKINSTIKYPFNLSNEVTPVLTSKFICRVQ